MGFLSFISILIHIRTLSIYPPRNSSSKRRNRTSSSLPEAYLIFQPIRFALPPSSLSGRWALTPPFHPYPSTCSGQALCLEAVCFLWHYLSSDRLQSEAFPLGSMALCVARTFLPPDIYRKSDRTTCTVQSTVFSTKGLKRRCFYFL